MAKITDRLWCPECEREGYHFDHSDESPTCSYHDCDGELVEPPARIKTIWRAKQGLAVSVFAAIFLGPIGWVVLNIGKKPLLASRTVTKTVTETQHYGILPSVAPFLLLWILIFIIGYGVSGGFPRP